MIEIIPAILPQSFAELEEKLALLAGHAPWVQVDVVDGIFAPSKTWPYSDTERFEKIVNEEEGMPFWEDFEFEFDCMVSRAPTEIPKYLHAGASRVVVHGAGGDIKNVLKELQKSRGGEVGIEVGVALLPSDDAALFAQYKEQCDFVQVMGIAKVGFQGSEFDSRALDLITSLRALYPELTIQIDGGVKFNNAQAIAKAGADRLIVGSTIFGAKDPLLALKELSKEVNQL